MKPQCLRKIIPLGLVLAYAGAARADFVPIPLNPSTYLYDLVVENTGPTPIIYGEATTASMDGGINNDGDTWNEQGYFLQDANVGLPPAGTTFTSISKSDHGYQMAPSYTAPNAVMLDQGYFTNTTVTMTTPRASAALSFLTSGGNGGCTFQYVVHHADGSTETGTAQSPDWWNGANPAWQANGRSGAQAFTLDNHNENGNPRLYSVDVTLNNATSPITSIDLRWAGGSGSGHSCVIAISGSSTVGGAFTPLPFTGYNADIVVEATAPRLWLQGYQPPPLLPVNGTMDYGSDLNPTDWGQNGAETWFEQGYYTRSNTFGIPHAGATFTARDLPDHRYTMPPSYSQPNALLLDSAIPSGTITLDTPASYSALSLLASSGGGSADLEVTVYYNDNSSEVIPVTVPDWFGGPNVAWVANGRIDCNWGTLDDIDSGNPRLYAVDFLLSKTTVPVSSITLNRTNGGRACVFALSGAVGAVAPVISSEPQSASVMAGTAVDFAVQATGTAPLTYQWQKGSNGVFTDLAGGTSSNYNIASAADADEAAYRVIVANAGGRATSAVATLTVYSSLPTITSPTDLIVAYGPQGSRSPDAENVTHAIDGLTGKYLNFGDDLAPIPPLGFTVYPSAGRSVLEAVRFYTANDAPERDPANYVIEGSNDGGNTWSLIASNSLALPDGRNASGAEVNPATQYNTQVRLANNASYAAYRVYFTQLKQNVNLMQIGEVQLLGTLDNSGALAVSVPPTNTYVYYGGSASLTASAIGNPTFQWLRNGTLLSDAGNVSGSTTATLTINPAAFSDAADYQVVVASGLQKMTSAVGHLTVYSTLSDITDPTNAVTGFNDGAGTRYANIPATNAFDNVFDNYRNGGTNLNTVAGFPPFNGPVGVVVTPEVGPTHVSGIRIYTGTGLPGLDPADVELFGSNDGGTTWTQILSGPLNLPVTRNVSTAGFGPIDPNTGAPNALQEILFSNDQGYTSYKVQFTHTRDDSVANSLQIGEIELLGGPAVPLTFQKLANGQLQLQWSQGTLVEAPDLRGPWTTNSANGSLTVTPTPGTQKFYRLIVQ